MFFVHFFENKTELLNQLLVNVPAEGETITIKGRKAKVTSVYAMDEDHVHVEVVREVLPKNKPTTELLKKKKR